MTLFVTKAPKVMSDLMRDLPQLSDEDAAAIVGNLGHESGGFATLQEIVPTVKGSRGGYGWAQWTGPRRKAFEAWCASVGLSPASDAANYGFLLVELRGTEKRAIPAVMKAAGLEAKVKAFELAFERAGVKHYPSRNSYAAQALAAFRGQDVPASVTKPVAKARAPRRWAEDDLQPYEIKAIQQQLRDLGYHQVGKVDADWGPSTKGAIIALQTTAGIEADGHYGPQTKAALADDGNRRQVSAARAGTTASDLREQGSVIAIEGRRITWTSVGSALLLAVSVLQTLLANWDPGAALPWPLSLASGFLPPWAAPLLVVALNLYNALAAKGIIRARVVAERTGLHNGEPEPAPGPEAYRPDTPRAGLGSIFGGLFGAAARA